MRYAFAVVLCVLVAGMGCSGGGGSKAPTANAGGPYAGTVGTAVSFLASASSDPQGEALACAWNFGDGGTGTGNNTSHTYTQPGTYTVTLTVTDTSGLSASATSKATIAALPPVANAGGPYTGTAGTAVSFSGSGSTDPQGEVLTYSWSFGDSATGTGVSPTHTYTQPGTYTVSLAVTNSSNLTASATSKATIAALPPVANAGGPYTGIAGTAVSFSGSGSTDPQGEALTYSWSFGDGATGTGVSPRHTYTAPGTYTVSLAVTNSSNLTASATGKATIAAAPPVDVTLSGVVSGGTQAVVGAHVYLFAANTTGYGQASVSLLNASATGLSDTVGAYVLTGSNGSFSLTGDNSCVSGQQLYLYVLGGNSGLGTNSASGLLAAVGACPASSSSALTVTVNEVTTIAAAYAFAGFATDATHVSSSGTALAQTGIANAFLNAGNLATLSTGVALATTPAGNGTVPQTRINTLANILAGCVNTAGPTSAGCSTLFASALSGGLSGTTPTDTATAAINIAHNPGVNIATLYGLQSSVPPFSPALTAQPNDFTIGINFPGGGFAVAIDGSGNAWSLVSGGVAKFSSTGVVLSPSGGYTGGGLSGDPSSIAIDELGNAWTANANNSLSELSGSGVALSPSTGYTGGGLNAPHSIAIDGLGNIWITNPGGTSVSKFSNAGVALSPSAGYTGGGLFRAGPIAIDGSGDAWIANSSNSSNSSFAEFSNAGVALSPSTGYISAGTGPSSIAVDSSGDVWIGYAGGSGVSKSSNAGVTLADYPEGGFPFSDAIAIDGSGNIWLTSAYMSTAGDFSELTNAGVIVPPGVGFTSSTGYISGGLNSPSSIAIDGSGDAWIANGNGSLSEFIGIATPVITPICAGLPATPTVNGTSNLGTRP